MSYQSFTPNEITSLQKQKGLRVYNGAGGRIRYLTMNVTRAPANNIAVRRAVAYLMPRQSIASQGLPRPGEAAVLDGARGLPRSHRCVRGCYTVRARTRQRPSRSLAAAGLDTPFPIEIWWTPTHYGDASADEYAEIKRSLERNGVFSVTLKSSEWAQYSSVLGNQYNVYQLGWFPDYPDAENYLVPVLSERHLHRRRLQQPGDGEADQGGAGRRRRLPSGSSSSRRSSCWRRRTCRSFRTGSSR